MMKRKDLLILVNKKETQNKLKSNVSILKLHPMRKKKDLSILKLTIKSTQNRLD